MIAKLLVATATRYDKAASEVLSEWHPECGCHSPGRATKCKICPCLVQFRQRVQQKILAAPAIKASNQNHQHLSLEISNEGLRQRAYTPSASEQLRRKRDKSIGNSNGVEINSSNQEKP